MGHLTHQGFPRRRPELSLLESHIHAIGIRDLINYAERHLGGKTSGRTLLRFQDEADRA